jgi:hypothetical protein
LYLREIESKEKNYEESYFGHRPRSGIENRWPKNKGRAASGAFWVPNPKNQYKFWD